MSLFLSMLPVYLFGNLHCIGMCGPLVLFLGQHPYRFLYFVGRTLSFSLAGLLAAQLGSVLNLILSKYHIPVVMSFAFGAFMIILGAYCIAGWGYPGARWVARKSEGWNKRLALLMTQNQPWPTFLFGFFTVMLPCGQTLLVFSACALNGDPLTGLVNGFAFAVLTSPSLWLAMNATSWMGRLKGYYSPIVGACALLVGGLAICRGCAEMNWIPHWILNPDSDVRYHIVMY